MLNIRNSTLRAAGFFFFEGTFFLFLAFECLRHSGLRRPSLGRMRAVRSGGEIGMGLGGSDACSQGKATVIIVQRDVTTYLHNTNIRRRCNKQRFEREFIAFRNSTLRRVQKKNSSLKPHLKTLTTSCPS